MEDITQSNVSEAEGDKTVLDKIKKYRTSHLFQEEIDAIVKNLLLKEERKM